MKTKHIHLKDPNAVTANLKPGDSFQRDRYEVHAYNPETKRWYTMARSATTLEEARKQLRSNRENSDTLRYFVDLGKFPKTRIVKVESRVTIIETE